LARLVLNAQANNTTTRRDTMQAITHNDDSSHDTAAAECRTARQCGITGFGTARAFWSCGTCSHSMAHVLDRAFDQPLELEEKGTQPLAGGIAQQGYQCGIVWGAALAAGARASQAYGVGPQAETAAVRASQGIVQAFEQANGSINCLELTDTDWTKKLDMVKNFLTGGPVTCTLMSARFAPVAFDVIESEMSGTPAEAPCSPSSCAAELVRRAGLSDEHAAMAAGFAGGIGLSGGACGALGAAVWVLAMRADEEVPYAEINARCNELIQQFLEASDYEMECAEIVGRRFEDVADHAEHLRGGGCARIIDALVAALDSAQDERGEKLSA
jgi:hypothetical protein